MFARFRPNLSPGTHPKKKDHPVRNIRSKFRSLLVCPSTFTKFYGARAFAAAAAAELWNSLPDTIKQAQTVNLFKTKLKTHLFLQ